MNYAISSNDDQFRMIWYNDGVIMILDEIKPGEERFLYRPTPCDPHSRS